MWSNSSPEPCTWIEAKEGIIKNFPVGRLPTIEEAKSLLCTPTLTKLDINKGYYWTNSINNNQVKVINFKNGNIQEVPKNALNYFIFISND